MEINFTVMLQIVPNKWFELLVLIPPGCGTIPMYENLQSIMLGENLCADDLTSRVPNLKSRNRYMYKSWDCSLQVPDYEGFWIIR